MRQIGVLRAEDGSVRVTDGNTTVADLPNDDDLLSTLKSLNLHPNQKVNVQHANGKIWPVEARDLGA